MINPTKLTKEKVRSFQEHCEEMADIAASAPSRERYKRLADGWKSIGAAQAWLDGEVAPVSTQKAAEKLER